MIIDVVLVALFLISIVYGGYKGAVKLIMRLVSAILAFVIAYMFAKNAGEYLANKTPLGETVRGTVKSGITRVLEGKENAKEAEEKKSDGKINFVMSQIEMFLEDTNKKTEYNMESMESASNDHEKISLEEKITSYIFTGIGFCMIYIAIRIIAGIVTVILEKIFSLPILRVLDKTGGMIVGAVLFFVEISIALALIYFLSAFAFLKGPVKYINSSIITNTIYNHNVVQHIIINKIK